MVRNCLHYSGRSRISQRGAPTCYVTIVLTKTAWKWNNLDPAPAPTLGSAIALLANEAMLRPKETDPHVSSISLNHRTKDGWHSPYWKYYSMTMESSLLWPNNIQYFGIKMGMTALNSNLKTFKFFWKFLILFDELDNALIECWDFERLNDRVTAKPMLYCKNAISVLVNFPKKAIWGNLDWLCELTMHW